MPSFQRQLEEPINDLQPIISESLPNKEIPQRVDNAIKAVTKVEKALSDAEMGEEQAAQALAALEQRADYKTLSGKVVVASTEYKALQRGVETKCQAVRSLIMAANRGLLKLDRKPKKQGQD